MNRYVRGGQGYRDLQYGACIYLQLYGLIVPSRGFGSCLSSRSSVDGCKRGAERERSALVAFTMSPTKTRCAGVPLFFPVGVSGGLPSEVCMKPIRLDPSSGAMVGGIVSTGGSWSESQCSYWVWPLLTHRHSKRSSVWDCKSWMVFRHRKRLTMIPVA